VWQGIFLTFSADSYAVRTSCVQLYASTSAARSKSKMLAAIPSPGHTKLQHTLTEMGSAALGASVLLPGKVARFSHKEQ